MFNVAVNGCGVALNPSAQPSTMFGVVMLSVGAVTVAVTSIVALFVGNCVFWTVRRPL